ncbi:MULTISPECIES: hypothetical protein [unclassified Modicisalibacter]|uniref:hypothetical protein n=1 Tax=unclassified Modicisalibacter TaxID=2679913 RepID=UPI001CC99B26|nr:MULTISPECIES: hypothetical protein [unclassified Modicisalibacter]MBZ9559178.1 hypothetical protein [Modicisalibacter sp. R2A 31.J]MBZ9576657.1 hypothetical protein [Modicisalibacter sp. MOD 31.J]
MKRLLAVLMTALLLAGCAGVASTPETRSLVVRAEPRPALEAGVAVLVEHGFVIRMADAELGRVDAVLAARSGYVLTLETQPAADGTRLTLSGRFSGRGIEPHRFATLLDEIRARLGAS